MGLCSARKNNVSMYDGTILHKNNDSGSTHKTPRSLQARY